VTVCERCGGDATRRTRCAICQRLCCVECIDWPRMAGGVRWCRKPKDVEHVLRSKLSPTGCDGEHGRLVTRAHGPNLPR
jgi:hypothetical protein